MFEVKVMVTETQEVMETLVVDLKQAEAIFKGYENDDFYSVEARFIRQMSVVSTKLKVSKEQEIKMNKELNASITLNLAILNLQKAIELGIDTDDDYDQVYWAEQELKRLSR